MGKYIHLLHAESETYSNYIEPYVAYNEETDKVIFNVNQLSEMTTIQTSSEDNRQRCRRIFFYLKTIESNKNKVFVYGTSGAFFGIYSITTTTRTSGNNTYDYEYHQAKLSGDGIFNGKIVSIDETIPIYGGQTTYQAVNDFGDYTRLVEVEM